MSDAVSTATETIHFARRTPQRIVVPSLDQMLMLYAGGLLMGAAYLAANLIAGPFSMLVSALGSVAGLTLMFSGKVAVARRRAAYDRAEPDLPLLPSADARLVCVGRPGELGDLQDVPFEPAVFPLSFGTDVPVSLQVALGAGVALTTAFVLFLRQVLPPAINEGTLYGAAETLIVLGFLMFLYPAHVRIMPGCLEVIRANPFGRSQCRNINLKTASILIDLHRRVIELRDPTAGRPLVLSILLLRDRDTFIHRLLLGAISTHTALDA